MNTQEMFYLHNLIEVNLQNSHLGQVLGVYLDLIKIYGVETVEVPLDIPYLFDLMSV